VPSTALGFADAVSGDDYASASLISIYDVPELYVVADWTGVAPDGAQRLALYAPSGVLYYSTVIPFSQPARSDVRVVVRPDGSRRVAFTLQIWGTTIERFQLAGTWRAEVGLDGGEVLASSTVVLE
jgi:hypothetical protein